MRPSSWFESHYVALALAQDGWWKSDDGVPNHSVIFAVSQVELY